MRGVVAAEGLCCGVQILSDDVPTSQEGPHDCQEDGRSDVEQVNEWLLESEDGTCNIPTLYNHQVSGTLVLSLEQVSFLRTSVYATILDWHIFWVVVFFLSLYFPSIKGGGNQ